MGVKKWKKILRMKIVKMFGQTLKISNSDLKK